MARVEARVCGKTWNDGGLAKDDGTAAKFLNLMQYLRVVLLQEQAYRTGVEGFDIAVLNTRGILLRELYRVRDNQSKRLKSQENMENDFKALMLGQLPLKIVTPGKYIPLVTSYAVISTTADQVSFLLLFK